MTDHASKFKGTAWVIVACLLGTAFAGGLSPLAHAVPWSFEKKLGNAFDWDNVHVCRANPRAEVILQKLVTRLYPVEPDDHSFSIDVGVAKNVTVNAYAGLGGKITINAGLLEKAASAEEVAGVLAHEIGHVHHRHILQAVIARLFTSQSIKSIFGDDPSSANWAGYFMTMDFSRAQEAEADEDGLRRLGAAHVDNQGYKHFFERLEREGSTSSFLSDHPSNASRSDMVDRFPNKDVTPIMTRDEWKILRSYCHDQTD